MQFAENKVVGFIDADLTRAFAEIPRLEIGHRLRGPSGYLFIEQLRRPSAPVNRAPADGVGKTLERNRRFPWDAPYFIARRLRLRGVLVQVKWRKRIGEPLNAGVLHMFWDREQSRFNDQRSQPAAGFLLTKPDVLGDGSAKGSAPNHQHIKWATAAIFPRVDLGEIVTEIATLNIFREGCPLGAFGHVHLLLEQ